MAKRLIVLLIVIAFLMSDVITVHSDDLNTTKQRNGDAPSENQNLNNDSSNSNLDIYYLELSQDSSSTLFTENEHNGSDLFKPGDKSRESTILWGGIFPFIAIPDAPDNNRDNPGFLSKESVSFFWYFKKKF